MGSDGEFVSKLGSTAENVVEVGVGIGGLKKKGPKWNRQLHIENIFANRGCVAVFAET